jgi:hypothetical protein
MMRLHKIQYENGGKRIRYQYSIESNIARFFRDELLYVDYGNTDVSKVPYSMAIIPFLGNMLPISWFIGFEIHVEEMDEDFYYSAELLKTRFVEHYPQIISDKSKLHYKKLVQNKVQTGRPALLFSGGVDSLASYVKHRQEHPHLVTIRGADIRLEDAAQFNILKTAVVDNKWIEKEEKHFIESNVRDFYTYRINLLFDDFDWWGRVQHGLSMISLIAPLSYLYGIDQVYMAASSTAECQIFWGSAPQVDNNIRWANVKVQHDSYDINRADKVNMLVQEARSSGIDVQLKVCYSNRHSSLNCSHCEKCLRTIMLIICSGGDPNLFGFSTSASVYDEVLHKLARGYYSNVMQYVWGVVGERIGKSTDPFVFKDEKEEKNKLEAIRAKIRENGEKAYVNIPRFTKLRYRIQLLFPRLLSNGVAMYRKIRR